MQILYIHNEVNISDDVIDNNILESINGWFSKIKLPKFFNQTIFQIAYFNKDKNNKRKVEESINKVRKENEEAIEN